MITIVTKGYCPYCKAARDLLDSLDVEYINHDVTDNEVLYTQVKEITGSHTVPQVFVWDVHGKFLGGYSEIESLHREWKLEGLLK